MRSEPTLVNVIGDSTKYDDVKSKHVGNNVKRLIGIDKLWKILYHIMSLENYCGVNLGIKLDTTTITILPLHDQWQVFTSTNTISNPYVTKSLSQQTPWYAYDESTLADSPRAGVPTHPTLSHCCRANYILYNIWALLVFLFSSTQP